MEFCCEIFGELCRIERVCFVTLDKAQFSSLCGLLTFNPPRGLGVTLELLRTGGGGLVLFTEDRLVMRETQPND